MPDKMTRSGNALLRIRRRLLLRLLTTRRKRNATGRALLWALDALGTLKLKTGTAAGVVLGSSRYRTWSSWHGDPIIRQVVQPWCTAAIVDIAVHCCWCLLALFFPHSVKYNELRPNCYSEGRDPGLSHRPGDSIEEQSKGLKRKHDHCRGNRHDYRDETR